MGLLLGSWWKDCGFERVVLERRRRGRGTRGCGACGVVLVVVFLWGGEKGNVREVGGEWGARRASLVVTGKMIRIGGVVL